MKKFGCIFVFSFAVIIITAEANFWHTYWKEKEGTMEKYMLASRLKVPTVKEVTENPYIYRYHHELCSEKGLIDEKGRLSRRYLYLQAVYRANLEAYLLETLDIKELDEKLRNSSLNFVCPKPENQDLYQRESSMGLRYICLRNNLYIEYLDKRQLNILEHHLIRGREVVTEELKALVKETYGEVIRVRNPRDWDAQGSFLYAGTQGRKPEIPNQALVLEISNAMEYDGSGNLISEDHMREKCEYLEQVKAEKEKEYSEILGKEVYILLE
ncbi:hypothetical protein IMSAGC018_00549 [Lachnospiraceae bacterium]|jgi:hypothetical protein|nr:hypothetical protein IMSAGC018_00549 [Lachnospiraceae bacterium]